MTEDDDGVQQTLSYGTDYSVVVSDDLHHLEINILYPGKYMYTITYNVLIKAEAESEENYVNTAEVDVLGHRFETSKNGSMAYSSAEEYVVSMQKTEKETGNMYQEQNMACIRHQENFWIRKSLMKTGGSHLKAIRRKE